jgi:hypothetical protein
MPTEFLTNCLSESLRDNGREIQYYSYTAFIALTHARALETVSLSCTFEVPLRILYILLKTFLWGTLCACGSRS